MEVMNPRSQPYGLYSAAFFGTYIDIIAFYFLFASFAVFKAMIYGNRLFRIGIMV
jgi:hypothetical protein